MAKVNEEKVTGLPEKEVVLETEYDLMSGLLAAASYKEDKALEKEVRIERNGTFLFAFKIRPISEEDLMMARKKATSYMKNPAGKNLPPIEKEVNYGLLRSWKIYFATVEEDRNSIWENQDLKKKYNIMLGGEMIDVLLTGGEKTAVSDLIDEISGYDIDLTEYAKN